MKITVKNFREKFKAEGKALHKKINNIPNLKKSWGVDRFIPDFIYKFDKVKRIIDCSPRESVIRGESILEQIQKHALEEFESNSIVEKYISFIEELIEDNGTHTEVKHDIDLYYRLLLSGDCLTTNAPLIYSKFIKEKCYAFKYDW